MESQQQAAIRAIRAAAIRAAAITAVTAVRAAITAALGAFSTNQANKPLYMSPNGTWNQLFVSSTATLEARFGSPYALQAVPKGTLVLCISHSIVITRGEFLSGRCMVVIRAAGIYTPFIILPPVGDPSSLHRRINGEGCLVYTSSSDRTNSIFPRGTPSDEVTIL